MAFLKLYKIVSDRAADFDSDDEDAVQTAPAMVMTPCTVNVAAIRCFYPRKNDRPGTRITFTDGGGFAVKESYTDVLAMVEGSHVAA